MLERDFPQWGVRIPAVALQRFWTMVAHYHGQVWNAAEPARALGVSESTTRRYLDLLTDAFMIRQLPPYFANIRKRQVKSPKIYIRDSGILHLLLSIESMKALLTHPMTPSIRIAMGDLQLEHVIVIYPEPQRYPLSDRVEAVPFESVSDPTPLFS